MERDPEEHNAYAVNFIEATRIIKQKLPGARVRLLPACAMDPPPSRAQLGPDARG